MHKLMTMLCAAWAFSSPTLAADLPSFVAPQPLSTRFYAHVGAAGLLPDAGASVKVRGQKLPGADIAVPSEVAAAIELGYMVTPNWAVSFSAGIPPTSDISGKGSIARFGKLGSTTAGPVAVTAHYHFLQFGRFQPYIGAGATYLVIFDSSDAALSRFRLEDAFGAVGQIGADLMVSDHLGVFLDLKKAYLRTSARGTLAGLPTRSDVKLDPIALTGGVTIRF